ncbi:MAG TPA: fibronectin type III domain-containing protein [Candidatus Angelobacter sp.]
MKFLTTVLLGAALAASAIAAPKGPAKDPTVRIVDGPRVEGVGPTWAVIAWTTNTGGSTVVRYGTDANNLSQRSQSAYADNERTKAQNHRVHLKNLKPNTKYFFVVDSGQGEGTGSEAKSNVAEFTTKAHK